jgi:hypothetical protein
LLDFNAKVCREDIYKQTTGNESLHEISNHNGVRVVNFATGKNLATSINILGRLQMGNPTIRLTIFWYIEKGIQMFDHSRQQIVILTNIWWWQKLGSDQQSVDEHLTDFIQIGSISKLELISAPQPRCKFEQHDFYVKNNCA